jgi:hypothetical protein
MFLRGGANLLHSLVVANPASAEFFRKCYEPDFTLANGIHGQRAGFVT